MYYRDKKSIFTQSEIAAVEKSIFTKISKGKEILYIKCAIRKKDIKLTPEEFVRQLFLYRLMKVYGYKSAQIKLEYPIYFGREVKKADIVIFEENHPLDPYIIVEVKKPKLSEGKEQLKSYCNATGAPVGVWTNGEKISYYQRKDPNYFEDIPGIPRSDQKLKDILRERWTISELIAKDKFANEHKTLSNLIEEMEDEVLANAGVDVFEEVFKLIYTKLYDEMMSERNTSRVLEFRNYGDSDAGLKESVQNLFDSAKKKWAGVFPADDKIKLTPSHLAICISSLQNVRLFKSNLDVIDDAFEYLMSKSQKGEKGQFFTPRYVIDMCIKMLNPKNFETMIDTAAGSCGFPVHTFFYVSEQKNLDYEDYVNEKVFAVDFDEKAVRVARTLNLISGDGKTNVLHLNTLDYERWNEFIHDEDWDEIYHDGWIKLKKLRAVKNQNRDFNFDIVMANPPFAGDIKEKRILLKYLLAQKPDGKFKAKVGRDILFIERNLQFLKPGGRMAIILPQGRLNNSSDKYIRDFIAERCRILAVVGLHGNVFKPHTGTKTSVLFVQKWDDKLCPRKDDYPIFFATMTKPSKDNSGEKIYVSSPDRHEIFLKDNNGHFIVDHDLFNHDGLTEDGIAEAFIQFAKKENLSFFDSSSFDEVKYKFLLRELECTEIFLSEVKEKNRSDAEFFQTHYVENEKILLNKPHILIEDYFKVTDGEHGSVEYLENGVKYLNVENIRDGFINLSNLKYVSEEVYKKNIRASLNGGEILISIIGTLGMIALADERLKPCIMNRNVAVLKSISKINNINYYVAIFLMTKFGYLQAVREGSGGVQPIIILDRLKRFIVPTFSEKFYDEIKKIFLASKKFREQADEKYKTAEKILAAELGLENFAPSSENIAVKSFAASFGATGRLDAEFYQPKYDDIEKKLLELSGGKIITDYFKLVKDICGRTEKFYNYVEIGDINVGTGDAVPNLIATKDLPDNAKLMTKPGDLIVSKVRPNRGAVSILRENNLLVSGAFSVLRTKGNYLTEVLQVLLRLPIYRELMLKFNVGTSYPVINDLDVINLPLPIIESSVQQKIAAQIEESFRLRNESKKLLELAKKAVEVAIEEGEDSAIKFIGDNQLFI